MVQSKHFLPYFPSGVNPVPGNLAHLICLDKADWLSSVTLISRLTQSSQFPLIQDDWLTVIVPSNTRDAAGSEFFRICLAR